MKRLIQICGCKCLRAIVLFLSFGFSFYALCQTSPRLNLGFDYIGAIVGVLSLLVVFTVSWQIINAVDVKTGIKKTDRALSHIKDIRKEMLEQFVQMEHNICTDYCIAGDYVSAAAVMKDAAYRYKDMYDNNIIPENITKYIWFVQWIFRNANIEDEKIRESLNNLYMSFHPLEKYDNKISEVCNEYDKRREKVSTPMSKLAGGTFSYSIKYAVKRDSPNGTMYMKENDSETKYHQFSFEKCNLNEAHLFSTQNIAMTTYRDRTDINADDAVNSLPIIITVIESKKNI